MLKGTSPDPPFLKRGQCFGDQKESDMVTGRAGSSVPLPYTSGDDAVGAHILWIAAGAPIASADFGWKASNLCLSPEIATRTPPGFALSKTLVAKIAQSRASMSDLEVV